MDFDGAADNAPLPLSLGALETETEARLFEACVPVDESEDCGRRSLRTGSSPCPKPAKWRGTTSRSASTFLACRTDWSLWQRQEPDGKASEHAGESSP